MALTGPVFFDTSVLLGGLIETDPATRADREACVAAVQGRLEAPRTAWHCCLEVYAVATRLPEEFRLVPADAQRLVADLMDRFEILELPAASRKALFAAAVADRLAGGRIYDAHLGEIARLAGSRVVVTGNRRHFLPLLRHEVRVLTAAELVDELA